MCCRYVQVCLRRAGSRPWRSQHALPLRFPGGAVLLDARRLPLAAIEQSAQRVVQRGSNFRQENQQHENSQAKVPLFKIETREIPMHALFALSSQRGHRPRPWRCIARSAHRELSPSQAPRLFGS